MQQDPAPTPNPDPVEDLLAACFEREESEWDSEVERLCREHPAHAKTLRRRFARLKDTASTPAVGAGFEVLPERLGEFRLLQRLGGGGMGVVYLAEQDSLKRKVALKIVRPDHLYFQGARDRFRREVEAAARCRHPGIVPVYAVGEADGIPYFAMEWVQGLSLGDVLAHFERRSPSSLGPRDLLALLKERGIQAPPSLEEAERTFGASWIEFACRVVRQAALALAHAHEQGVLHRDLKPSNLMLGTDGQVRLVDFGCSLAEGVDRLTRTGTELGSLPYMAPEQIRSGAADRRTDVYGLGVTLYELLTLKAPYLQPNPDLTRKLILEGRARAPRLLNQNVSWDAETVCLVAMDKDPERRYASMQDLAADLTRILEHRPIVARRPGALLRVRRAVQRHPTLAVGCILGALLVIFGPLALWLQASTHAAELATTLADVERLSDERVLADLVKEEQELWPMVPEKLAGEHGMLIWLARAERLLERQVVHERDLAGLRERALPRTREEEQADEARSKREKAEFVDAKARWEEVEANPSAWSTEAMLEIATRHRRLRFSIAERYTYRFARPGDQWRHDKLIGLVNDIREFGVLKMKAVRERRARAESIERKSLLEPKELWATTIAEIATDPRYHGLKLTPQRGLVPLGRDSQSKLFEFAHVESGVVPKRHPRTGRLLPVPEDNAAMVFVLLPGARARIGSDADGGDPDEGPSVEVEFDPFFVSKHEMNQTAWWNCFGDEPSTTRPNSDVGGHLVTYRHPVETISWRDANLAMQRLELELPTEAQWEYAARGGEEARAVEANLREGDPYLAHAPVGTYAANGFGLHEVIGNVAEWCLDRREPFSVVPRPGDGLREAAGSQMRVVRGGSYLDSPDLARLTRRVSEHETNRLPWIGVRPVRRIVK